MTEEDLASPESPGEGGCGSRGTCRNTALWQECTDQTASEAANREADKQRQFAEAAAEAARVKAEKERKAATVCGVCAARYQGCIGARLPIASCQSDFRQCVFHGSPALVCPAP